MLKLTCSQAISHPAYHLSSLHCSLRTPQLGQQPKPLRVLSRCFSTKYAFSSQLFFYGFAFIRSFRSLSYDRSINSSTASSPQGAIQCFLFQFPGFSRFLNIIQYLLTSSSSSSCHFQPFFYLSFNNMFQKGSPTQYVTNPVRFPNFYCTQDIPFLLDSVKLHFSHDGISYPP